MIVSSANAQTAGVIGVTTGSSIVKLTSQSVAARAQQAQESPVDFRSPHIAKDAFSTQLSRSNPQSNVAVREPVGNSVAVISMQVDGVELVDNAEIIATAQVEPIVSGASTSTIGNQLTAIAAVAISGERVVITQADGTFVYDDSTNIAFSEAAAFITTAAGVSGSEISAVTYGPVSASYWNWVPGLPIFLGPNGTLTQTVPAFPNAAFSLQVAVAETATTIFWDPQPSIVLA